MDDLADNTADTAETGDTADTADTAIDVGWVDGIDVCEHHCVDFDTVSAQGFRAVIVRAGRGTRQDARWIEHVSAARTSGLAVGSYWHLYPSRAPAHHQAELWMSAVRAAARWDSSCGHWADISSSDGFDPFDLGRYVAAFLRRADELLHDQVGVFASREFLQRHVYFDDPARPRWDDGSSGPHDPTVVGIRTRVADRGSPGRHRLRLTRPEPRGAPMTTLIPKLVARGATESLDDWRARWIRTPQVTYLQTALNDMGAELVVDGVYGPATDAAVRTCGLLCRRDRLEWPLDTLIAAAVGAC